MASLLLMLLFWTSCSSGEAMKSHEKEIMFTVEQVGNLTKFFPNFERHETYTREETEDELILRYEFNTLSSDGSLPFYLVEEVIVNRSGKRVDFPTELKSEKGKFSGLLVGVEEEDMEGLFAFGEHSKTTALIHDALPIGNTFRMQNENYSVSLLLGGYSFKTKEDWNTIFLPYLEYLQKEVGVKRSMVMQ